MRAITTVLLALLLGSLAAAEHGELPLRIITSSISDHPRPALAVGAFKGGFGIRAEPDRSELRWLPDVRPKPSSVGEAFGKLDAPPTDSSFLVLAALPLPWRPTALERDGEKLIVHGDAVEAAAARPDSTGEDAKSMAATHEFALVVPRTGIKEVRLVVRRFAPDEPQTTLCWSVGRFEAAVSVGAEATAMQTATRIDERAKPGQYAWVPSRIIEVPFGGDDHAEGLIGVGKLDLAHLGDARPPVPAPAKPGDELVAVVVSPVLQTGEWAQVRSLESFLGRWKLTIVVFHDRGGRDKNIPHRDAFIVRLPDPAGAQPPEVDVRFETLMADEPNALYRPYEPPKAVERGELALDVVASGVSSGPEPALRIGSLTIPLGSRPPNDGLPHWQPELAAKLPEWVDTIRPPNAAEPVVVVASLPMPWRPRAIEREDHHLVIRGDAVRSQDAGDAQSLDEPAGAKPDAAHVFACNLGVLEAGTWTISLAVDVHGRPTDGRYARIASATCAAEVELGDGRGAARSATTVPADQVAVQPIIEKSSPGPTWSPPRSLTILNGGGNDKPQGVAGVGGFDFTHLDAAAPPAVQPHAADQAAYAVIVTPMLQTGEWVQVRSLTTIGDACDVELAVFHDTGERAKNIPHRDAMVVAMPGTTAPSATARWVYLIADRSGGLYQRAVVPRSPSAEDAPRQPSAHGTGDF